MRTPAISKGRRPARAVKAGARPKTFTAPTRGLVTNQNLSNAVKEAAFQLENWFPTERGIRLRGGAQLFATIAGAVTAMFSYSSGGTGNLFAADADNIYDITAPGAADVVPTPDISGLSGGAWSTVQFETPGGDFLIAVNGADTPREFDGTSWSVSTMTGSGLTVSNLTQVWAFKERLYFIEDGSMKFWYLPTGAKTGSLTSYSLAGVFSKGGTLLFGATWSLDSGDGPDDLFVVVSTKGEVAVYQGSNPATDFQIVGVYQLGEPMGKNAHLKVAGDLLILTEEGIIPISAVLQKDPAALSLAAVTRRIEPTWKDEIRDRGSTIWSLVKWDLRNMLIVGCPAPGASVAKRSLVANAETGAWTTFSGEPWDVHAQAVHAGQHYTGAGDGKIYLTESTGSDAGAAYTCTYVGHFDHLGYVGPAKVVSLGRARFRATQDFIPKLSVSADYTVTLPAAPNSIPDSSEDAWDEGLWDAAIWDGTGSWTVTGNWVGLAEEGAVISPQIQVTCGVTPKPDAELMSIDLMFELAGIVV